MESRAVMYDRIGLQQDLQKNVLDVYTARTHRAPVMENWVGGRQPSAAKLVAVSPLAK